MRGGTPGTIRRCRSKEKNMPDDLAHFHLAAVRSMRRQTQALALLSLVMICGCASKGDQRTIVQVPIEVSDRSPADARWRMMMAAQDRCHEQGYQDAYLLKGP